MSCAAQRREGEYSPSKQCRAAASRSGCAPAQRREGEYSPSKVDASADQPAPVHAQRREGEYSPSKWRPDSACSPRERGAQRREGEYSPSKSSFPIHAVFAPLPAQRREGEYSPSKFWNGRCARPVVYAQRREGEYSPSKAVLVRQMPPPCRTAQRREGEYSPSKCVGDHLIDCRRVRSTKGGGIFPLQGPDRRGLDGRLPMPLNEGRGNIPPPSSSSAMWCGPTVRSTKGGGIFPLQVADLDHEVAAGLDRSTKGGGIFPLQDQQQRPVHLLGDRSTKGGGIFPLQAVRPRSAAGRGGCGRKRPLSARNCFRRSHRGLRLSRSTVGSHGSHRIQGLPV